MEPSWGQLWRKSSFCASGECVEIASAGGMVLMRNSTDPENVLRYSPAEWHLFLSQIKAGDLDDLA